MCIILFTVKFLRFWVQYKTKSTSIKRWKHASGLCYKVFLMFRWRQDVNIYRIRLKFSDLPYLILLDTKFPNKVAFEVFNSSSILARKKSTAAQNVYTYPFLAPNSSCLPPPFFKPLRSNGKQTECRLR